MAAPGAWFVFGFEGADEPPRGPDTGTAAPRALPLPPGGVRALRPGWDCVVIVTGSGAAVLRGGAGAALPGGCRDAVPGEGHVLLVLEAALEARSWAALRGAGAGAEERAPAWRRPLPPAAPAPALPLVPGGFAAPRAPFFWPLPARLRARRLALGLEHALLLGAAGLVYTWGSSRHGQLGHGGLQAEQEPRVLEALQGLPVADVAAGGWHSACVSDAGDLYVWGWNASGQLALPCKALARERRAAADGPPGAGAAAGDSVPSPGAHQAAAGGHFISIQAFPALLDLPRGAEVRQVNCGSRHTAAVTRQGELYTWGWGKYGQLGHGDRASSDQPRVVAYFPANGLRVEEVVCGPWTTYVRAAEKGEPS
ncbi:RCC1 domain-containing protein 1 isoform X2 [Alligator mississippiensis]|uniref:RCC1 domain-containing protein 1 isoform X2 n=1 Tax=Alligator mississippiensis TaxID=8496 RepID=UPI0028781501|nr:RCC1 domain-containing protein 1 isoform X2 [Alligator mississippiensis]